MAASGPGIVFEEEEPARARPRIVMEGVSKTYGDNLVLSPLDLEVDDGEFFCLLGPSGSGKTTTLNLIGGFISPTTGKICISGQRVDTLPPYRRPVNTVFQSYALFPHMTVRDNVAFGLKMGKVPPAELGDRTEEALKLVRLLDYSSRYPAELSGGQQQRVAVARALVNRPDVLLLDEPLGALDLKLRQQLQEELARIHREIGTTFVYVTHDQTEAMMLADRIAVMNEGRVEQIGSPEEIYLRPRSRFVADFIGDSNLIGVEYGSNEGVVRLADGVDFPCKDAPLIDQPTHGHLLVRPELISIAAPNDAPGPHLIGRVRSATFLGPAIHVMVDCDALDSPLVARIPIAGSVVRPTERSEIAVWWAPDDAVLLQGGE